MGVGAMLMEIGQLDIIKTILLFQVILLCVLTNIMLCQLLHWQFFFKISSECRNVCHHQRIKHKNNIWNILKNNNSKVDKSASWGSAAGVQIPALLLIAVWPPETYLTPWCLSFFIYKMRTINSISFIRLLWRLIKISQILKTVYVSASYLIYLQNYFFMKK